MRIVLDTNVLVSGLLNPRGTPGRILQAWEAGHFELVMSEPMLAELGRVLRYPKIQRKTRMTDAEVDDLIFILRTRIDVIAIDESHHETALRDPEDHMIAATYRAAAAELLISGDGDLLALSDSISVVTPAQFAQRL